MKLVSHLAGQLLARLQAAVTLKDREARLLAVVAQSFDGILVVDRDYRIIEWNAAQTNLTGYSEEEMLGQKVWDYFYQIIPDENKNPELFELIKSRVQDPPAFMINTRNTFPLQCKDGSRKTMEVSWSEVETRGKKLYCVIMRDVTQRQTAEQNYQMLFREMRNGFALHEIILDEKGTPVNYRFLAINPAFERMTGLKAGDIVGKTVLEVMPNLEGYWIETYGRVALTGEPVVFENYSHELNQHFNISAFQPQTGQFACIIEDITERKRAETELRDAHDKLETLWNIASMEDADTKTISETVLETITHITGSQVGFYGYVTDDETAMEIAAWSRGVLERCSVGEETLKLCMSDSGVWAEGIRQRKPLIINDYNDDIPGKKGLPEGHIPIKNLMVVPHFLHHKIISIAAVANRETGYNEDDAEQISTFLTSIEAIVDRKRAEEALRKSEERYHLIDEASQDLIYSYDLEGRLTHANTKLCLLLGRRSEEIIGKTNEELGISPEQGKALAREVQKVLQTKQS
ncbi:MAG TPA: PAS domain S-box protein [Anaerolineaceae bacterium]|nr:PAS domain S-box protein [Anaerolineaceae bacterium]